MSNWSIQKKTDDLVHYGVLGMKWGVRRYQNKDGSLTAAGRKHYGKKTSRTVSESKKSIQSQNFLTEDKMYELEKKINYDVTTWNELAKKDKEFKRMDDAAYIGLEALFLMGYRDADQSSKDTANKWWFCFEDQTIGLPLVADLVLQGKSKSQILTIFEDAANVLENDNTKNYYMEEPYFDLAEAGAQSLDYSYTIERLDKFIDGCIEAKKNLKENDNNWEP